MSINHRILEFFSKQNVERDMYNNITLITLSDVINTSYSFNSYLFYTGVIIIIFLTLYRLCFKRYHK